jgi:hypothetical protein
MVEVCVAVRQMNLSATLQVLATKKRCTNAAEVAEVFVIVITVFCEAGLAELEV